MKNEKKQELPSWQKDTQFMIKKQKKIEVQVEQRLMKQKRAKQLKEISVSNLQDPINLAP